MAAEFILTTPNSKFLYEYLIWYNLYIRSSFKWKNILMEAATDGKKLLKSQDAREIVETFFQD